jgi:hypothetical protein
VSLGVLPGEGRAIPARTLFAKGFGDVHVLVAALVKEPGEGQREPSDFGIKPRVNEQGAGFFRRGEKCAIAPLFGDLPRGGQGKREGEGGEGECRDGGLWGVLGLCGVVLVWRGRIGGRRGWRVGGGVGGSAQCAPDPPKDRADLRGVRGAGCGVWRGCGCGLRRKTGLRGVCQWGACLWKSRVLRGLRRKAGLRLLGRGKTALLRVGQVRESRVWRGLAGLLAGRESGVWRGLAMLRKAGLCWLRRGKTALLRVGQVRKSGVWSGLRGVGKTALLGC